MTNERANNRDGDVKSGLLCLGGPHEFDRLPYRGVERIDSEGDDHSHVIYELQRIMCHSRTWQGSVNVWVLQGLGLEQAQIALRKADALGYVEQTDCADPQWKIVPEGKN
jgi:hypothetical protein